MLGPCASCKAHYGRSCCELPAGVTPTFGVTTNEIARIVKATGRDPSSFVTAEQLTPEEWMEFIRKSDIFAQLFARRIRIRLNVVPVLGNTNACTFLSKSGCSLPADARPGSCRLYPFWFDRELVKGDGSDDISINSGLFVNNCYGHQLAKSGIPLLNMFNTNVDELTNIARRLVDDAHDHALRLKDDKYLPDWC